MENTGSYGTSGDIPPEGSGDLQDPDLRSVLQIEKDVLQEITEALEAEDETEPGVSSPVPWTAELEASDPYDRSDDSSLQPAAGPVQDSAAPPRIAESAADILKEITDALSEENE